MATDDCNRGRSLDERTAIAVLRRNGIATDAVSESSATPLPVAQDETAPSAIPEDAHDPTAHDPQPLAAEDGKRSRHCYLLSEHQENRIAQARDVLNFVAELGGHMLGNKDITIKAGQLSSFMDVLRDLLPEERSLDYKVIASEEAQ